MDSVTIDLNRAERATPFSTNNEQERYKPKTLPDRNNGRYAYLPIFPTKSAGVNEYLLLANIPVTHLAPNEIAYKMAIIAVLPDDRSILLRYLIETLFIIHGETKLNMICPIGSDVMQRYGHPYHLVWCANLNRLPMVTSTFIE
ncbi:unnamed protein product [Rotaria sp. Silwood1]|nr:unnamed protein product [Rotaria sp. Silwood1]